MPLPRQPDRGNARADVVNRTHRVVREQALRMRREQQRSRSLLLPLGIASVLLCAIVYAVWAVLSGYDMTPNGIPDASDQLPLLLIWLLPLTACVVGLFWMRHLRSTGSRSGHNNEVSR